MIISKMFKLILNTSYFYFFFTIYSLLANEDFNNWLKNFKQELLILEFQNVL